jgi:hypothetical protein
MWAIPCITAPSYHRAVRTRVAPLVLSGPEAGGSPKQPGPRQVSARRSELEKEAPDNWVAYFDGAQS